MYGATNTNASTTSQRNPSGPFEATVPSVSRPTNAQTVKNTMSNRRSDLMSLLFSASAKAVVCSATTAIDLPPGVGLRDALPGLGEDFTEDSNDLPEFLLPRDERRRDLHYRVAPVIGAADQSLREKLGREEAPQQRLRLLVRERLARFLVLHELERPEVARASQVADDVELEQRLELRAEGRLLLGDARDDPVAFHDLEVLQGDRAAHGVTA